LEVYRRLIPQAAHVLAPGGWIAIEIGHGQDTAVRHLLHAGGFTQIASVPDLQGIPRVAVGQRP
jgi:release factor glutamine methyltransferase